MLQHHLQAAWCSSDHVLSRLLRYMPNAQCEEFSSIIGARKLGRCTWRGSSATALSFHFPASLHSSPHLWSWALGGHGDSEVGRELGAELLFALQQREPIRMPPGPPPLEAFWARPTHRRPRGGPRIHQRDYILYISSGLGMPEDLENVARERGNRIQPWSQSYWASMERDETCNLERAPFKPETAEWEQNSEWEIDPCEPKYCTIIYVQDIFSSSIISNIMVNE